MGTLGAERAARYLELAGVLLLLGAALITRARDLAGPFDRGQDGARAAGLLLGALRAETPRAFGPDAQGPSPALAGGSPGARSLARASLRTLRPSWDEAWVDAVPPEGVELPLRLPFLLASLVSSWALWSLLRRALGTGIAMIGLAFHAAGPIGVLYGGLAGGELPGIAAALLALRAGLPPRSGSSHLAWAGWLVGAGLCEPRAPLLVLPWLVGVLGREGVRPAISLGLGAAPGALAALLTAARSPWSAVTVARPTLTEGFGALPLAAAAVGAALAIGFVLRRPASAGSPGGSSPDGLVPLLLLAGGVAATLAARSGAGGDPAWLFLGPGVAACAALPLGALARPLLRLRAGVAPHALAVGTLALPGLAGLGRARAVLRGPEQPTPAELGAALAARVPPTAVVAVPPPVPLAATSFYAWRRLVPADAPAATPTHSLEPRSDDPGVASPGAPLPGGWQLRQAPPR